MIINWRLSVEFSITSYVNVLKRPHTVCWHIEDDLTAKFTTLTYSTFMITDLKYKYMTIDFYNFIFTNSLY